MAHKDESPKIITFVGKPKSGKSYAIKNMLYQYGSKRKWKFGRCYSRTGRINNEWDCLPDEQVRDYDADDLLKYIGQMRQWREDHKGKQLPPNFLILDDLLGIIDLHSPWFLNFISTHRHTNTWVLISAQYLKKGLSTTLRECTNLAFIWRTKFKNSLEGLWECYGQDFKTTREFKALLDDATKVEHRCLLYDGDDEDVRKIYKYYLAPSKIPKFKLKYQV